jgi:hypothetical protein
VTVTYVGAPFVAVAVAKCGSFVIFVGMRAVPMMALLVAVTSSLACGETLEAIRRNDHHAEAQQDVQRIVAQRQAEIAAQDAATKQHLREREEERGREKAAAEKKTADQKEALRRNHEEECAVTRPSRLAQTKEHITAFITDLKKAYPHAHWIEKHCRYEDTRGVLVQRQRTSDGVVIRTKDVGKESEATCDGPRPGGVTAAMVEFVLDADAEAPVYSGRLLEENRRCVGPDEAAGVELIVLAKDGPGMKAILAK